MGRRPEVGAAWENGGIVNHAADACPAGEAVPARWRWEEVPREEKSVPRHLPARGTSLWSRELWPDHLPVVLIGSWAAAGFAVTFSRKMCQRFEDCQVRIRNGTCNCILKSRKLVEKSSRVWGINPGLPHCRRILYQLSHKSNRNKSTIEPKC